MGRSLAIGRLATDNAWCAAKRAIRRGLAGADVGGRRHQRRRQGSGAGFVGGRGHVVDLPAKLAHWFRMLDTGDLRKTDAHDAHSVAVAAVRAKELRGFDARPPKAVPHRLDACVPGVAHQAADLCRTSADGAHVRRPRIAGLPSWRFKAPAPPAQRPCGRRCRAVLGPPTAGGGVVPRGSRPLNPRRRNNLDGQPLDAGRVRSRRGRSVSTAAIALLPRTR